MEKNLDRIHIRNLEVFANHGVFPEENRLGQKFLINAVLYTNMREAGRTDELKHSVDYGEAAHFMTKFMTEHTFRLIESAAEQMAKEILLEFERLERIDLEIQKPWAPIGLPLESVSVEISREWHQVFLSAGSNLGDKGAYIRQGIEDLNKLEGCVVEKVSKLISTEPYGFTSQPEFLNGIIQIKTLFTPQELLEELHGVETRACRERKMHWGPRTLDLDIIFYDDLVLDTENLQIPHRDMAKRQFVLEPMAELAPYKRHPGLGKTVEELLEELQRAEG